MFHKTSPTPGSHPRRTRTGHLRIVTKFALVLIHFRPMILLNGAVSFHRPHAPQPFVITKDTASIATRHHILLNSAGTLLLMLAGASTPYLVSSGTTASRTAAGKNACCAIAVATKQEDQEPVLARAAAIGQAGNTARFSHTTPTPVAIRKARVPDTHSRDLTAATVKAPIAQPYLCTNQSFPRPPRRLTLLTCALVHRTIITQMRVNPALSALVIDSPTVVPRPSRVHRQHCQGNKYIFH